MFIPSKDKKELINMQNNSRICNTRNVFVTGNVIECVDTDNKLISIIGTLSRNF